MPSYEAEPRGLVPRGAVLEIGAPIGALALVEGAVGGPLEQLGVVAERADMAPIDLVRAVVEVVVAERLEAAEHRVDLTFPGNEGGKGIIVRR